MTEVTTKLVTSGLHCRSCSMLVDMTVGDLPGVAEVKTDHVSGDTEVRFDSDVVTLDQILDAIRGAGYEAEPAI